MDRINVQSTDSPEPGASCVYVDLGRAVNLKNEHFAVDKSLQQKTEESPFSCVSMKSDNSMYKLIDLKKHHHASESSQQETVPSAFSCVSMKSDNSMYKLIDFENEHQHASERIFPQEHSGDSHRTHLSQTGLNSVFMLLEENIVGFVKSQLKKHQKYVSPDYQECLESQREEEVLDGEDEEQKRSSIEAFLKITVNFLKKMKQEELAECLQSKTPSVSRNELKATLKKRSQYLFEGIAKAGYPTLLNQIYTDLYITEGGTGEVNDEHEVRQIETASSKQDRAETRIRCHDIFIPPLGRNDPIRTVLTKGVAGIGKTVLTQKFTLDWAEGKANQDIQFTFPLTFRELNVLKEKKFSLVELVHLFFTETKGISRFEEFQVVFIFDGLDECRLPLDFHHNEILTDVTESTSVDVLLTNLIRGNLLPSARLWITTRPAAANQIPPGCVDMVTEVRGFTDPQKEEYFKKRFGDKEQASGIISFIKASRSLHIMCCIPVFCWITATVLEDLLKTRDGGELPKTLTEMYIHFLVVQTKLSNIKYHGQPKTDQVQNEENKKMILSLGKLAFEQLQKGNLVFYESDLLDCGIDIRAASVYSGMFTQIFKEERGLYQDKIFCFIHLSVQEFLAALHVHLMFFNSGVNLLSEEQTMLPQTEEFSVSHLYQVAVEKALQSQNGHLDLFLRFLLGLSLQTNKNLLQGIVMERGNLSQSSQQQTIRYIKERIGDNSPPERSINLFYCLKEVSDHSLVEEIQGYLGSGSLSIDNLSPAQWSALVFILLSSEKDLDMFDLKKYSASEEGLLRLLPVIKASNKALLDGCNLSEIGCKTLVTCLSSWSSNLRELDLSNNDLQDSGLKLLSFGLESQKCRLETLRLSGCMITEKGCVFLASALRSNPSHLRELDLSYNHPGESGEKLLFAGLKNPHWRLESLRLYPVGAAWLKPGPRKYACDLTLDPNTTHRYLCLFENNKKVLPLNDPQPYPEHPDRYDKWPQLLCRCGLTGRCYWEVECKGDVQIAVTYKDTGEDDECLFGGNKRSWSLCRTHALHNKSETTIYPPLTSNSNRVGVYLDWPAGILSFYTVSSDSLTHLHTFYSTFTEPVYPGFGFWSGPGSSVTLCEL